MISYENGVFHMAGKDFSYLFRILPTGQPEQLHFGPVVMAGDAEALACKTGTGWGCSVNYAADGTCLDVLPLEWSGSGRGDYRESPLELETEAGPIATDFVYDGYEILEGTVPMDSGLPQARDGEQTGLPEYQLVHRAPSRARESIWGVRKSVLPMQLRSP